MGILVVEDSPQQGKLHEHILKKGGFNDILLAESAAGAFEILGMNDNGVSNLEVDLILMDLLLPDMNGIEACQVIMKTEKVSKIPIIVVTGVSDKDSLQSAFDSGAVDYIVKPVHKVELLARVRSVLKLKQQEEALHRAYSEMERRVEERTLELKEKTHHLEEVNTALKILLKQREEDREELGEAVLSNVKNLIYPYLEKMKATRLSKDQLTYLEILESHINAITSPFVKRLSQEFLGLTPMEVCIADLIREGKTTKEIAELLHRSESTILFHRDNIRSKLGLKVKKINLRSYLRSFM
jgi:DNA-binding NarL/FixJ family response regulator